MTRTARFRRDATGRMTRRDQPARDPRVLTHWTDQFLDDELAAANAHACANCPDGRLTSRQPCRAPYCPDLGQGESSGVLYAAIRAGACPRGHHDRRDGDG